PNVSPSTQLPIDNGDDLISNGVDNVIGEFQRHMESDSGYIDEDEFDEDEFDLDEDLFEEEEEDYDDDEDSEDFIQESITPSGVFEKNPDISESFTSLENEHI